MKMEKTSERGKLDAMLRFLLRESDESERALREIEKVLDPFWDRIEKLYPTVSRNDDPCFMLVAGLVSDIEDAAYKAGFFAGFSVAQEMEYTVKK